MSTLTRATQLKTSNILRRLCSQQRDTQQQDINGTCSNALTQLPDEIWNSVSKTSFLPAIRVASRDLHKTFERTYGRRRGISRGEQRRKAHKLLSDAESQLKWGCNVNLLDDSDLKPRLKKYREILFEAKQMVRLSHFDIADDPKIANVEAKMKRLTEMKVALENPDNVLWLQTETDIRQYITEILKFLTVEEKTFTGIEAAILNVSKFRQTLSVAALKISHLFTIGKVHGDLFELNTSSQPLHDLHGCLSAHLHTEDLDVNATVDRIWEHKENEESFFQIFTERVCPDEVHPVIVAALKKLQQDEFEVSFTKKNSPIDDLRSGKLDPEFVELFDVAFAVHCISYAHNETEMRNMVHMTAMALKKGGRLIGVRECLDSKAYGQAQTHADIFRGPLGVAFKLDCKAGQESNIQDFCRCEFMFGNSDGSTFNFQSHSVAESTMLTIFADEGLEVVQAGPRLAFDEEGKQIFDQKLQGEYGKLMWYFDLIDL